MVYSTLVVHRKNTDILAPAELLVRNLPAAYSLSLRLTLDGQATGRTAAGRLDCCGNPRLGYKGLKAKTQKPRCGPHNMLSMGIQGNNQENLENRHGGLYWSWTAKGRMP